MEEIHHEYTTEITCPWCGYEERDSWEANDSGQTDCGKCDKPFTYERDVSVTYSTEKVEEALATNEANEQALIN